MAQGIQLPHGPLDLATPRLDRLIGTLRLLVIDSAPESARVVADALGTGAVKTAGRSAARAKRVGPQGVSAEANQAPAVTLLEARSLNQASLLLEQLATREQSVDLVLLDRSLVPQRGSVLPEEILALHPEARAVVLSATPSLDEAMEMIRRGALDYLPKPLHGATLRDRLRHAAGRRYLQVKTERRLVRLKQAVRHLNDARRTVGRKVDLLCNDLISAYGDVSRQLEEVRVAEHFRKLLESSNDLEQMLCHTMDWLLRNLGNCNLAIFLTDEEGASELGAYMKYTVAGDPPLTKWLQRYLVPRTQAEGFFRGGDDIFGQHTLEEGGAPMRGQSVMAVDCTYLAESLGTIIAFRHEGKPFGADAAALLQAAGPVFAVALTNLVRAAQPGGQHGEAPEDEDLGGEWWQRGDESPF